VNLKIGQAATFQRTFTQDDFDRFAALSGDDNPIHVDPNYAARTRFGKTVAHGMLLYSLICAGLGEHLPGPGTIQIEQELTFSAPTFAGEEITIRLEVIAVQPERKLASLLIQITKPNGESACQGQALVRIPLQYSNGIQTHFLSPGSRTIWPEFHNEPLPSSEAQTLRGLRLGQKAMRGPRAFTADDVRAYTQISGDANPIIVSSEAANLAGFGAPLLPGGLLGGMISAILGTQLPGKGTNWLKQRFRFHAPVYPGESITANVEITRLRPDKDLVDLRTWCLNPAGDAVCTGKALVLVKDLVPIPSNT
jgi:acyl dehydratase